MSQSLSRTGTRRSENPDVEAPKHTRRVSGTLATSTTRSRAQVLPSSPQGSGDGIEDFTKASLHAHPVGMRWPALAQAPAFRAPGGAAVTHESDGHRQRSNHTTPTEFGNQHTSIRLPRIPSHLAACTPRQNPDSEPARETPVTSSQLPADTGSEARRTSKRVDRVRRDFQRDGPGLPAPATKRTHSTTPQRGWLSGVP